MPARKRARPPALFACLALALAVLVALPASSRAGEGVVVFGASSVTDALRAVGEAWAAAGHDAPRFSFAASSTLARQIEAGAPADILVSANVDWMDYLEQRGLIAADTRRAPVGNRLVMVAPAGSRGAVSLDAPDGIRKRLGDRGRLAVGDPAHVPAGIYAAQALRSLGLWDGLEPRLARADNVRAALALVERGEAPLGVVYATDARIVPGVEIVARFPEASHEPIAYPMAIVAAQERPAVRAFFDFLTRDRALAIFARYGFERRGG